jgi:hypothetical protein
MSKASDINGLKMSEYSYLSGIAQMLKLGPIHKPFAIIIRTMKTKIFHCFLFSIILVMLLKDEAIRPNTQANDHLGDFDRVHVPNRSSVIARMITVLKPDFTEARINEIAAKIHSALNKYKIEPQIVVAIIDTESDFDHTLISSTGDLSMAQVNVDIWNKEFDRMNLHPIKAEKLKIETV